MKIIKANNNSIAAGRDVNINVTLSHGKIDVEKLFLDIEQITGLQENQILQLLRVDNISMASAESLQRSLQKILFGQSLSKDFRSGKFLKFADTLDEIVSSASDLSLLSKELHSYLGNNKFLEAYETIEKMLESQILPDEYRKSLAYEYFQTGYIYLANTGDRDGITALYDKANRDYSDLLEPEILCLLAEMQQEVATRKIDTIMLLDHLSSLKRLEGVCSSSETASEHHSFLLALCLRRIGERGDVQFIEESIILHQEIIKKGTSRPIELANSYGNALIRRYEALGDLGDLDKALEVLNSAEEPRNTMKLSEFQAFPKVLNARGNVYKQKIALSGKGEHYAAALEAYSQAERYWSEESAPYEWAMVQKNKADAVLMYARKTIVSEEVITTAIANVEKSLKYRNNEQASHQYQRSLEVLDALREIQTRIQI